MSDHDLGVFRRSVNAELTRRVNLLREAADLSPADDPRGDDAVWLRAVADGIQERGWHPDSDKALDVAQGILRDAR